MGPVTPTLPRPETRGRVVRRTIWISLFWLVLMFHLVVGWVYSGTLLRDAFEVGPPATVADTEVVAVDRDRITLRALEGNGADLARPVVMGFESGASYLQIAAPGDQSGPRDFTVLAGPTPAPGARGDLQAFAFPADPAAAGLAVEEVEYDSPLGPMDAWYLEGSRGVWVIHVHGKGSSPQEAIRLLRPLASAGYPQLAVTYRNDPGQPADPSGLYQYGRTEWADLEAAVEYAEDQGAGNIVLVGYSTGGAVALSYLFRSGSEAIAAVVLDAPNLDMSETVDFGASQRSLPGGVPIPVTVTAAAKFLAGLRADVNWDSLDYVRRSGQIVVPVLVFHGTADGTVPIETSRRLAEREEFVTLVEVPGAGHVQSWNADPAAYERRVLDFLARFAG
jgi:hypothetical protein